MYVCALAIYHSHWKLTRQMQWKNPLSDIVKRIQNEYTVSALDGMLLYYRMEKYQATVSNESMSLISRRSCAELQMQSISHIFEQCTGHTHTRQQYNVPNVFYLMSRWWIFLIMKRVVANLSSVSPLYNSYHNLTIEKRFTMNVCNLGGKQFCDTKTVAKATPYLSNVFFSLSSHITLYFVINVQ